MPKDQLPVPAPPVARVRRARRLPAVRRSGATGDRHAGHVRRLVLVLPALLLAGSRRRPVRRRGRAPLDARHPVRRRGRARDPAPAVQPVRHQGAARRRPGGPRRAVRVAAEPGAGAQRGEGDEQVVGQRCRAGRAAGPVRRRRGPADDGVRRAARGRHRLGGPLARRDAAVPGAGAAAGARRAVRGLPTRTCAAPRTGPCRLRAAPGGVAVQRGRRARDGAGVGGPQGDRPGCRRAGGRRGRSPCC